MHPDGRPYTREEKRAILAEARETARKLLAKLEELAAMDDREEGGEGE